MTESPVFTDAEAAKITRVEELAYELVIDQVMTKQLITLDPKETMHAALEKFRVNHISGAPVQGSRSDRHFYQLKISSKLCAMAVSIEGSTNI